MGREHALYAVDLEDAVNAAVEMARKRAAASCKFALWIFLFQEVQKPLTVPPTWGNCHAHKTHSQCLRGRTPKALREPTLNSCAFRRIVQKRRFHRLDWELRDPHVSGAGGRF
jgi:hypothetical protein